MMAAPGLIPRLAMGWRAPARTVRGLRGMRDRVETARGSFTVRSTPGAGTTIAAVIPCAS